MNPDRDFDTYVRTEISGLAPALTGTNPAVQHACDDALPGDRPVTIADMQTETLRARLPQNETGEAALQALVDLRKRYFMQLCPSRTFISVEEIRRIPA
ncbi:MAG TPA: hypothetical protein VJB10_04780 [Candidatus Peribacteraceae bacterium]|nr:MAG: hypothetical protein COU79_00405 [Candidatus Peregrinibacteria bacterium CG10_big_fil_rev_8_21_14_0_10_54_7]HLD32873.1 hypothetical protein [Candidatus Peribacteraceae bacterium]